MILCFVILFWDVSAVSKNVGNHEVTGGAYDDEYVVVSVFGSGLDGVAFIETHICSCCLIVILLLVRCRVSLCVSKGTAHKYGVVRECDWGCGYKPLLCRELQFAGVGMVECQMPVESR